MKKLHSLVCGIFLSFFIFCVNAEQPIRADQEIGVLNQVDLQAGAVMVAGTRYSISSNSRFTDARGQRISISSIPLGATVLIAKQNDQITSIALLE